METKLKLDKEDQFFIDLLFDRYQNPLFDSDTDFFEIIDRKKETLYHLYIYLITLIVNLL
jgi:hypothetical protein